MATTKPTLGSTALEAWRNWRVLPCFGQALGVGEFCWQPNQAKPAGQKLHRVINELATRPATESEEDEVWDCMLKGALRIPAQEWSLAEPHLLGTAIPVPALPLRMTYWPAFSQNGMSLIGKLDAYSAGGSSNSAATR